MNVECRDILENAEIVLRTGTASIEELARIQRTVYTCSNQVRTFDERAGDTLGILAYRLRSRMRQLSPDRWQQYL